jgi:hypothetical protein
VGFGKHKTMKKLLLVSCIFLMAFVPPEKIQTEDQQLFQEFLNEFELIKLPYKFRYNRCSNDKNPMDRKRLKAFDNEKYEKFAISNEGLHSIDYYKRFETNGFHGLIFRYGGDDYFPVVVTYTKSGEIIAKNALSITSVGYDCGLEYCSETGILRKDLTIFCVDTARYDYQCDTTGEKIPNSDLLCVNSQKGKLLKNGNFQMDSIIHTEKKWKKRKKKP